MNEITRIHLARTPYNIEVAAKKELEHYLGAIHKTMSADDDMLREIEARMVELLADRHVTRDATITSDDVDFLKTQLGEPRDFADDETRDAETIVEASSALYRDEQNAWLGGVAAGIAVRFGLPIVLVRVAFIALALASFGVAVLLYVVAWLVVPPARSSAQRLEMQGRPVTLTSLQTASSNIRQAVESGKRPLIVLLRVLLTTSFLALAAGALAGGAMLAAMIASNMELFANEEGAGLFMVALTMASFGLLLLAALSLILAYASALWRFSKKLATAAAVIFTSGIIVMIVGGSIGAFGLSSSGHYDIREAQVKTISTESLADITELSAENYQDIRINYLVVDTTEDYGVEIYNSPIGKKYTVDLQKDHTKATLELTSSGNCLRMFGNCIDRAQINIRGPELKRYEGIDYFDYRTAELDELDVDVENQTDEQADARRQTTDDDDLKRTLEG